MALHHLCNFPLTTKCGQGCVVGYGPFFIMDLRERGYQCGQRKHGLIFVCFILEYKNAIHKKNQVAEKYTKKKVNIIISVLLLAIYSKKPAFVLAFRWHLDV